MKFSATLFAAVASLAAATVAASDDTSFTTTTVTMTSYLHQHTSAATVQPAYTYHFTNDTSSPQEAYVAVNGTSSGASNTTSNGTVIDLTNSAASSSNATSLLKRSSPGSTPVIKSYQNDASSGKVLGVSAMGAVVAAVVLLL